MGLSAHNNKPLFTIDEVAAYLDVLERIVAEQFYLLFLSNVRLHVYSWTCFHCLLDMIVNKYVFQHNAYFILWVFISYL